MSLTIFNSLYKTSRRAIALSSAVCFLMMGPSCKKGFLDIVPDNVATIDHVFSNRNEAEKYLFTCYSYMPKSGGLDQVPSFLAGGQYRLPQQELRGVSPTASYIDRGDQNVVNPIMDFWNGDNGVATSKSLWKAIRDCNIFLEGVDGVIDLRVDLKERWRAEVKALKAYYYFYLMRMYGPLPLFDQNLSVNATIEEVQLPRSPIDDVVSTITTLADSAAVYLPSVISDQTTELGRLTKAAALSIKAHALVWAASPLFNGNPDYANFKNHDGTALFSSTPDPQKWEKAAEACKEAIDAARAAGHLLYKVPSGLLAGMDLSDTTLLQMDIRLSLTEKWNVEVIWGERSDDGHQANAMARIVPARMGNQSVYSNLGVGLEIAESFYSENGVPIDEDNSWDYSERYIPQTAGFDDRFYIREGYSTAKLNFNREPRFYASLGFDGGVWFMQNTTTNSDNNTWFLEGKTGQPAGKNGPTNYNSTGYWPKKVVNWKYVIGEGQDSYIEPYTWPIFRLVDLYLLYAEALTETNKLAEAIEYLDLVRERSGLDGVVNSWTNHSKQPTKFSSKEGLREIVHQERANELVFEGHRFWDLRRWKKASTVLNNAFKGWDVDQSDLNSYYRVRTLYTMRFVSPRDYLWPIKENDIVVNPKLVQNPGW